MPVNNIQKTVQAALDSRKALRDLKRIINLHGSDTVYNALNHFLGDLPDGQQIRKTALAIGLPEADLRNMAESPHQSMRRISRLILLESKTGVSEDPLLQKGLSDKAALIRCDAARFAGTGSDRTRLYNRLIRLIREDPDVRVRRSAGKRLSESFADLYSVDFNGLPPLSQMLIIDALEGHSRADEESVESLLDSENQETSFRAARILQNWGTLKQIYNKNGKKENIILTRAASLGVADYLESIDINDKNKDRAIELAGLAGREDLVRFFSHKQSGFENLEKYRLLEFPDIVKTVFNLLEMDSSKRDEAINNLPLKSTEFKSSVELLFPEGVEDLSNQVLFEMARLGHWTNWTNRLVNGLLSGEAEVAVAAISALVELNPGKALLLLPPMLMDTTSTVRREAAKALSSMPAGEGIIELGEYLKNEPEENEDLSAVYSGIKDAGGAAIARCILDNAEIISKKTAGRLLNLGIDELGVELLADGIPDKKELIGLFQNTGIPGGLSILSAWPVLGNDIRKKILSSLAASRWSLSIDHWDNPKIEDAMKTLSKEERSILLEPVLENAGSKNRRHIHRLIRG